MNYNFDFKENLKIAILHDAKRLGIKIIPTKSLRDILIDYLTVYHKIIPMKKRRVFVCPELIISLLNHPKAKEIQAIIKIAQNGGNLNIFQSKRLPQTNFHDHMMTEWNIYHFHLSLEPDKRSCFVKQVNALLFAYIDDDNIVFLGTDTHKDGIFGESKWWMLIHDNFPEVIAKYKTDAKDVYPSLTAKERQSLWNAGISTFMIKVRDTVYYSPNLGRMTSGHNMMVIRQTMAILDWIDSISKQLEEHYDMICKALKVKSVNAQFKMLIYEGTLILAEMSTKQQVLKIYEGFDLSKISANS